VRLDTKFTGQQSWLVQAIAETVPMAAPPPDTFWQLPADSANASYGVGWKPGRLKPLGRSLGELFDAYMEAEKVPAALRAQGSKALEGVFDLGTSAVHAEGGLTDIPSDPVLAADYRLFGWRVTELPGDPKPVLSVFDGLTAAFGSRDFARIMKQRAQVDEKVWPKFSAHAASLHGFKGSAKVYHVEIPRSLLELLVSSHVAMAKDFEDALAAPLPKGKAAVKSVPLSLIVASDGSHTFVGASADEKALIKRLESLKDPKPPTLQTRAGLEGLRSTPHASAGFLSLRGFAEMFGLPGQSGKVLSALPHQGETPMLCFNDETSEGPDSTLSVVVPRAAIEDIGALVPLVALTAKQSGALAQ
jgi:hypothetical protein